MQIQPSLVSSRDGEGKTPLHYASISGRRDLVEELLARQASIGDVDLSGWTALHHAASHGCKAVVEVLVANQEGVNATDSGGCTPLSRALQNGHLDVANYLRDRGGIALGSWFKDRMRQLAEAKLRLQRADHWLDEAIKLGNEAAYGDKQKVRNTYQTACEEEKKLMALMHEYGVQS